MAYNILLVDDSKVFRSVLKKAFQATSIKVNDFKEAENGQQGLSVLKESWVDLVFLDINMPVMNGMEFMRTLTQDPDLSRTPVVVVSTEGSQERIEELEKLGIKSFLRKPVSPEKLVEVVEGILGREKNE